MIVMLGGAVRVGSTSDGSTKVAGSSEEQAAAINATSIPANTALARRARRPPERLAELQENLDWRVAL